MNSNPTYHSVNLSTCCSWIFCILILACMRPHYDPLKDIAIGKSIDKVLTESKMQLKTILKYNDHSVYIFDNNRTINTPIASSGPIKMDNLENSIGPLPSDSAMRIFDWEPKHSVPGSIQAMDNQYRETIRTIRYWVYVDSHRLITKVESLELQH